MTAALSRGAAGRRPRGLSQLLDAGVPLLRHRSVLAPGLTPSPPPSQLPPSAWQLLGNRLRGEFAGPQGWCGARGSVWGPQAQMEPARPLSPFFTGWARPPEVTVEPGLSSCAAQAHCSAGRVDSRASVQSQVFSLC